MANTRFAFKKAVADEIVSFIVAGGFPHIAAEAAGIPFEVFQGWMDKGQKAQAREPYKTFSYRVRQAVAQARISAEIDCKKDSPLVWLRNGPGRDMPGSPGWAKVPAPSKPEQRTTINFLSPEWIGLWSKILQALSNFPEAKASLALALKDGPSTMPVLPNSPKETGP